MTLSNAWFRPNWRWFRTITLGGMVFASSAIAGESAAQRPIERYDVRAAGMNAGAAKTIVLAPDDVVRSVVTDFGRYESFITKFKAAKIVGRVGDKTDVYLQVPIIKGAVKIWAIVRFDPPKQVGADTVISGKMVKGNVKRLDATWRWHKLDSEQTDLRLELLIVPDMPVPESLVLGELRYAAAKAVGGTRDEAERRTKR